ncbi:MAG: hypothetical protein JWM11_5628 [Planctomycetaceae bacterium]|nr:hypothetical protein [Planctomycetaceae bacterium]
MKQSRNWLVLGLMAFGVAMRVLPYVLERYGLVSLTELSTYTWNVSPVPAMCLLGGAYFTSAWLGFGLGFAAFLFSDVLIGLVSGQPRFMFYSSLPFVYAGFILFGLIGLTLRGDKTPGRIIVTAFLSELAFFLLTNFGEWAVGNNQYPETFFGLLQCYAAAIPFWRNSLLGMCIYAPILFGLFALLEHRTTTGGLPERELELVRVRR